MSPPRRTASGFAAATERPNASTSSGRTKFRWGSVIQASFMQSSYHASRSLAAVQDGIKNRTRRRPGSHQGGTHFSAVIPAAVHQIEPGLPYRVGNLPTGSSIEHLIFQ